MSKQMERGREKDTILFPACCHGSGFVAKYTLLIMMMPIINSLAIHLAIKLLLWREEQCVNVSTCILSTARFLWNIAMILYSRRKVQSSEYSYCKHMCMYRSNKIAMWNLWLTRFLQLKNIVELSIIKKIGIDM